MQLRMNRWAFKVSALMAMAALAAAGCSSSSKKTSTATATTTAPAGNAQAGASCGSGTNTASATGVTADTIKLGLITDLTGVAASTFADTPLGVQARIDVE